MDPTAGRTSLLDESGKPRNFGEGNELLLTGVECGIRIYVFIYIHTHSLSIFCIRFLIILFYSVDGMIWDDIFS